MKLVLGLLWLPFGAAYAGECAIDADLDGYAGSELAADGDGSCASEGERPPENAGEDCNDADPAVYPGAAEVLGDLTDDDCDGSVQCFADLDGDGWRTEEPDPGWHADLDCNDVGEALADAPLLDCNDGNPDTWPGAPEIIGNDFDEDCDGLETCYADADEDGFRTDEPVLNTDGDCDDAGEAHPDMKSGDCDDRDPYIQDDCRWRSTIGRCRGMWSGSFRRTLGAGTLQRGSPGWSVKTASTTGWCCSPARRAASARRARGVEWRSGRRTSWTG